MTIEKAMNVFRQLQSRSHSFASAFGSLSAAVTIMILPSLATSIRAISTPAAIAARMARVTSCCRNVEGARAMGQEVCLCAVTSEPRNEIPDELGLILRPISRGELLAHGVERLPDVSDLRKNDFVAVECFVVLCLDDLEHSHDQIVWDIIGGLGHTTGGHDGVRLIMTFLSPLLEAGDQRCPVLAVNPAGVGVLVGLHDVLYRC